MVGVAGDHSRAGAEPVLSVLIARGVLVDEPAETILEICDE